MKKNLIQYNIKVLLIINSTVGKSSNIGFRAYQIFKNKPNHVDLIILCRDSLIKHKNIKVVYPFGEFIPRLLHFINIYIFAGFKYSKIDKKMFRYFTLKKIRKMQKKSNLEFDIIHLWQPDYELFEEIKNLSKLFILDIAIMGETNTLNVNPIYNQMNYFTVPSPFIKNVLEGNNIDASKIFVNRFGANLKERLVKSKNDEKLEVLFVGDVSERKGAHHLLDAWSKLDVGDHEKLILCGRVPKTIKKKIKNMNLRNVYFKGFVEPSKYYLSSDLFILPSRKEGSAKVIFEAMSYGLPVITTPNAGSVIENNVDGKLIEPNSVNKIIDAISFFRDNKEYLRKMGDNAYNKVKNYSWERYAEGIIYIYYSII